MPSISSLESSDFGEYSSFCILNLSFRPGVALTAWPGFSYFGPRIAFHATSFMITETRHGLAVHISGYSDETGKSRVRTKPTSRQHQEAEVDLRVFDSSAHRCKSRMGVLRANGDRPSPRVSCSARANPFVKTRPEDNYRPGSRFIYAAWNKWRSLPLDDVLGGIQ